MLNTHTFLKLLEVAPKDRLTLVLNLGQPEWSYLEMWILVGESATAGDLWVVKMPNHRIIFEQIEFFGTAYKDLLEGALIVMKKYKVGG